ncbi:LysR family transcriptional regulator ArgP [Herbiconiux sp. P18]|uniref:LysR family transcriptional regulator ArgP n=1 Tax=Herbiconiux liangxiaofengii TaxID=3342795 RepID=UPI0035B85E33
MILDPAHLQALRAAVDEGTFDAAARALSVTPSAVSQRIKALETDVGRVLLKRSRPVRPTESGRSVLRLARQLEALSADVAGELGAEGLVRMPLAVNADSLATWLLPALAPLAGELAFEFLREDEGHTTELLRDGAVMAAVTAEAVPVQGCSSTLLGAMRYRPLASESFARTWFPGPGSDRSEGFATAPVVVFDRRDELQHRFLRSLPGGERFDPPRQYVPASGEFVEAVRSGYGWGMVPDLQRTPDLVELAPGEGIDVPLFWQQWQLRTSALDRVAAAIGAAASTALRRPA